MGEVIDGPWPKKNDPKRVAIFGGCPMCHENHGHVQLELVGFDFGVMFWHCTVHRMAWEVPEELGYLAESGEVDIWKSVIVQEGYTESEPWYGNCGLS